MNLQAVRGEFKERLLLGDVSKQQPARPPHPTDLQKHPEAKSTDIIVDVASQMWI